MKKVLLYIFCILSGVSACKKDDDSLFDNTPDERLHESLTTYQNKLTGAENGWKGVVYTKGGGTYNFYFKFNNQNRVVMYSDFDSASAVTSKESSYRLKALQQPSLLFDTYSYIHLLADPNEANQAVVAQINNGPVGQGLRSDFEFYFDAVTEDTVKLTGRFHGSKAILVRASKAEADGYNSRQLLTGFALKNLSRIVYYFKRITINNKQYDIAVNERYRTITFSWIAANGSTQTFTTEYYYTLNGVGFATPFTDGTQVINGFTNITWNAAAAVLNVNAGTLTANIVGVSSPFVIDLNAPSRWWQYSIDQDNPWISLTGFTVNGVTDALKLSTIPGFDILFYYAQYGQGYDWLGFITGTELYGPAFRAPVFFTDGRAIFTYVGGEFGSVPPANATIVASTRNQFSDLTGYYFVQTSPTSYDMVSARDSRIWMTWEWPF